MKKTVSANSRRKRVEIICGSHPTELFDLHSIDILIKNPGIRYENVMVEEALKRNIPVWTEVELAYHLTDAPFIGITGSNGKTTTTTLVYEMLKADSKKRWLREISERRQAKWPTWRKGMNGSSQSFHPFS